MVILAIFLTWLVVSALLSTLLGTAFHQLKRTPRPVLTPSPVGRSRGRMPARAQHVARTRRVGARRVQVFDA